MKVNLTLITAALLVISVAGCGDSSNVETTTPVTQTSTTIDVTNVPEDGTDSMVLVDTTENGYEVEISLQ